MIKQRRCLVASITAMCIILIYYELFVDKTNTGSNQMDTRTDALNKQAVQNSKSSFLSCSKVNETKYIIYNGHNSESSYNNIILGVPPGWNIVLVNTRIKEKDVHDMYICTQCELFEGKRMESVFTSNKELNELQRIIPKHDLNLLAAYIYVLHRNAQWIFTTNGLNPFEADWLNYATCHNPKTGLFYNNADGKFIFDACKHFSDTTQSSIIESQVTSLMVKKTAIPRVFLQIFLSSQLCKSLYC